MSQIRQNYDPESEAGGVNKFLHASYTYQSLCFYFNRLFISSRFTSFFQSLSEEMREQSEKLLTFQNRRGSRVVLQELIKKLGYHVTNLKRVRAQDEGLGEYLFDCLTLGESST